MAWSDVAPSARSLLNDAAERAISLEIRAIDYQCWRCGKSAAPPVLVHPTGHTDQLALVEAVSGDALTYMCDLLATVHHPTAGTIKLRSSRTRGDAYLSHGCPRCDALFGAFPLREAILDVLLNNGVAHLEVVAKLHRPLVEWWALSCDRNNLR